MAHLLTGFYSLMTVAFLIWCVVLYFREPKRKLYIRFGAAIAIFFVLVEITMLLFSVGLSPLNVVLAIIIDLLNFLKIIVFVVVGMTMTARLGITNFPLIRYFRGKTANIEPNFLRSFALSILIASIVVVVYSFLLFKITGPELSSILKDLEVTAENMSFSSQFTIPLLCSLIGISLLEEIVFRLAMQNTLAFFLKSKQKYLIAVLITSAVWTMGHLLSLEPVWVKALQVFPIGIILGYLYKKYGFESTFIVHLIMNLVMVYLSPELVR
ncbi:MAG: hypothetical protein SCALA702_04630 [Melioribacteraceae bacterium]|nr:MAG: hypothetical protein SCALA702_04630 [Melioribacteraceae bacterium]